jgi:hypothetical protein
MLAAKNTLHPPTDQDQWPQLNTCCAHCISLAQEIASRLKSGETGQELMPLLKESATKVRQLQEGIQHLSTKHPNSTDLTGHGELLEHMRKLLQLEEQNRSLLSSKGIPLNRPRPYRYQPRRTPQS